MKIRVSEDQSLPDLLHSAHLARSVHLGQHSAISPIHRRCPCGMRWRSSAGKWNALATCRPKPHAAHGQALTHLNTVLSKPLPVERELGGGSMATAYVAQDLERDRQAAIKVLRPEFSYRGAPPSGPRNWPPRRWRGERRAPRRVLANRYRIERELGQGGMAQCLADLRPELRVHASVGRLGHNGAT